MWMMCLGGLGGRWGLGGLAWIESGDSDEVELRSEEVVQSWEVGKQMAFSGENGSSDKSDGDGVVGGVSMDGIGWSLKQADS